MKAFRQQDETRLENIIKDIEDQRQAASLQVTDRGTPLCSAGSTRDLPNQLDLDRAKVMELELRGLYARLTGQSFPWE